MRIAMIGTGYVGLVSGACLSEFGHHVTCVDKDAGQDRGAARPATIPIFEPGLDDVVAANVKAGRLAFTTDLAAAVKAADAVFIAVGTPSRRGDGHADLTYVFGAAEEIATALNGYTVVVTKSTVPVGTSRKVEEIIRKTRARMRNSTWPPIPNSCAKARPSRTSAGPTASSSAAIPSARAMSCARSIARSISTRRRSSSPRRETSELIKYAANAFLATKITFINEMADICEKVGADVQDVARGIGLDGRIGSKFLHAGPGFGGSCFPKDTLALLQTAEEVGAPTRIVEAVVAVNDARKTAMAEKIVAAFGGVDGKTIAMLGLTFKPNTDDMRDAPSLVIVPHLQAHGARIRAYDPEGAKEAAKLLSLDVCEDAYEALDGADGVVILTEWNEFRALDLGRTQSFLKRPLMVDLRNIYRPAEMAKAGFDYVSVGRPQIG